MKIAKRTQMQSIVRSTITKTPSHIVADKYMYKYTKTQLKIPKYKCLSFQNFMQITKHTITHRG